jgi:hypothetical protein
MIHLLCDSVAFPFYQAWDGAAPSNASANAHFLLREKIDSGVVHERGDVCQRHKDQHTHQR